MDLETKELIDNLVKGINELNPLIGGLIAEIERLIAENKELKKKVKVKHRKGEKLR